MYAVVTIVCFVKTPRVKEFHYKMFHGVARRHAPDGRYIHYHLGQVAQVPLRLVRTGTSVPDLFMPVTQLVVSDRVRRALCAFDNVDFFEATFEKLVDMEFRVGDMSWYDDPGRKQPPELFDDLPDVAALHSKVGRYSEVITIHSAELRRRYPDAPIATISLDGLGARRNAEVPASTEILEEYPVFSDGSVIVFRDDAFRAIDQYVDRDFFLVKHVDV